MKAGLLEEYRALLAAGYSPELRTLNGLCYRHMRFVHEGIGIQSRIDHDSVDQVVYDGSDAVDTAKSIVKRGLFWLHGVFPQRKSVPETDVGNSRRRS